MDVHKRNGDYVIRSFTRLEHLRAAGLMEKDKFLNLDKKNKISVKCLSIGFINVCSVLHVQPSRKFFDELKGANAKDKKKKWDALWVQT